MLRRLMGTTRLPLLLPFGGGTAPSGFVYELCDGGEMRRAGGELLFMRDVMDGIVDGGGRVIDGG